MSRPRSRTMILAPAFGIALAVATALPAVASDGPTVTKNGSTYTLKVLETDSGDGDIFIPKGGEPTKEEPEGPPSAGDAFGFAAVLTQDGTKVGTDTGRCTIKSIDVEAETGVSHCRVTMTFANGTITVEDTITFDDSDEFDVDIASGTGAYEGIKGTVNVHDLSSDQDEGSEEPLLSDLTFTYTLGGGQVSEVPSGGAAAGGGNDSTDTALLFGIAGLAAVTGLGVLAGGRRLAATRR